MRASHYFLATLRETPKDAEIISHQYLLRAGMIKKLGSGLYTWLPLGLRVLQKVEAIVREEMNKSGALEVLMPAVQPAELWQETGRWETFGGQLLTMQDSQERDYCFGPTHEEVMTDVVRKTLQSYQQLPVNFYQIQTKFRDEIRPRFGLMRAREFIMKDAYSFHLSHECLQKTYDTMVTTYECIFNRLGLRFRAVEADTGAIGGAVSHEFQVLADAGEDLLFYSDTSSYAANIEQATYLLPKKSKAKPHKKMATVSTPTQKTIAEVAEFLKIEPEDCIKILLVVGKKDPLVALVLRGDDELNTIKAEKHPLVASPFTMADEKLILKHIKVTPGFLGPVNLPKDIPVIADHMAAAMVEFTCGANKNGHHLSHAAWGRDADYADCFDLRNVKVGDPSPDGQGHLQACRDRSRACLSIGVKKYAKSMQAEIINAQGETQTLTMGCYGLGVSRVVAAAIEQHHDAQGIIWPASMAPFQLVIIPINGHRVEAVKNTAEALYAQCLALGIDVLLDDRLERPGVLFADHDLIGIPHRIVISERHLQENKMEYKARNSTEVKLLDLDSNLRDLMHS